MHTRTPSSSEATQIQSFLQASDVDLPQEPDCNAQSIAPHNHPLSRSNRRINGILATLAVIFCALPALGSSSFGGSVKGGFIPISSATVRFFAVGNSGYGSAPALLAQTKSDNSGAFTVSGYVCPASNPQTYVLATGGNSGNGFNSAIGLMALTGHCQSLASTSFVSVNELTTVAAQLALEQFIDTTGMNIGTSTGNARGLANAVAGAEANLVTSVGTDTSDSGIPAPFLPTAGQCSPTPTAINCDGLERLNSLANVLAGCVSSAGPSSSQCSALFGDTATPSTATTLEAAHHAVTHPKSNVKALFGLQQMASSPYQPSLRSAPDGWELALLIAPASANFNLPVWVALDGAGNVWIVNGGPGGNSVTELPAGDYNNAINIAPPGAQFFVPFAIATDTAGNVFVANAANNSVSELPAGNFNAGATNLAPTDADFSQPAALALDKSANLWVANLSGGTGCSKSPPAVPCGGISELRAANYSADGVHFAPSAAKFDGLLTVAFDAIGNLWTSNEFGNSVTEFTAAKPRQFINYAPASAGFVRPIALALDAANNVWVVNSSGGSGCGTKVPCGSVTELPASNPSGAVNFNPPSAEILGPNSIAVDSKGNLWVSNAGPSGCESATCGSVSELVADHPNTGAMNFAPRGAAFQHPTLLALDESGNVWVSQFRGVTEIVGLAGPVLTPIQACLKTGSTVCRP